jgi:two-component system, NtrC family, sensor kinase
MSVFSFGALITSITCFALGILVYAKRPERVVNQSFLFALLAVSTWSFGYFGMTMASQEWIGAWWTRYLLNVGAIFSPVLFLKFVFSVSDRGEDRRRVLTLCWGLTLLFIALNLTPWFFQIEPALEFRCYLHGGPIYPLFEAYFFSVAGYGLYLLLRGYQQASGLKRNQLKYLFWTWLIGFAGAATTFPATMHIDLPPWGLYLIPVCIGAEAYAIVRYRSMDIRIVLRRGMVYSILLALLTATFLVSLRGFEKLFESYMGYSSMFGTAIVALLLAIGFQPLKDRVQALVDRLFFKGAYDYHRTLREMSEAMTSFLDLEKLVDHLLVPIIVDMKLRNASLFLMNRERTGLRLLAHRFYNPRLEEGPHSFLPKDSWIVRRLEREPYPLLVEEMEDDPSHVEVEGIRQEMARLKSEVAVPVAAKNELLAMILLGPTLSGDVFSQEDLGLLSTLANQAAVAIENARLYDEVNRIKEYLENILRNLESGVITVDNEGKVTTLNRAAEKMTQWKVSEVLGKDCRVMGNEITHVLLAAISERKGRPGVETTLHTKVGEVLPIGVTTSLLQSQQGTPMGAIALFGDLTERKELEQEKWRAEKLAYIGTIAASIAHEIKNPLVSVKTLAQLLPEKHSDAEFRDHFSQIALKEVDRIDLLVSQMLDLKGNGSPSRMEDLRIEEILDEVLLLLSNQIERGGIRVERQYHAGPYGTRGDRFQLKQALWNIVLNSLQSMEGGGILSVSVEHRRDGGRSEGRVMLRVSDTGRGISEEHLKKVFDPFFTTKPEGTGLGLSICDKIITEHRGNIQVESQLNQGTSLSISLPAVAISNTHE